MAKKYVFTGGPNAGKTALIDFLAAEGFDTLEESAMQIIKEEVKKGGTCVPWIDAKAFQDEVFKRQYNFEQSLKHDRVVFLDRSFLDSMAFCKAKGINPCDDLLHALKKTDYYGVFLLELVPIENNNPLRKEDRVASEEVHNLLHDLYKDLGYDIIVVPFMPINERAEFVKDKIREL